MWVRRSLGWGSLRLSSQGFCLLLFLWGRDISRVNPGYPSSTPDPGRAFLRLFLGKEEGVKCISRAWQEPAKCYLPWMGSNKASAEMVWLEGDQWQWETSVRLPKQPIC